MDTNKLSKVNDFTKRKYTKISEELREVVYDTFGGHDYVDMGLPSGTLWAKCNVGATTETGTGTYFSWGDVVGATKEEIESGEKRFGMSVYPHAKNNKYTKYCDKSSDGYNGYTDDLKSLELCDDAAHVNMGGEWRMPSTADMQELDANCDKEIVEDYNNTGVTCSVFTSKVNGEKIVFPVVGYCENTSVGGNAVIFWLTDYTGGGSGATVMHWSSGLFWLPDSTARSTGAQIRGILKL